MYSPIDPVEQRLDFVIFIWSLLTGISLLLFCFYALDWTERTSPYWA